MDHRALLAPSLPISECLVWVEITERCSLWGPSRAFPALTVLSRQPEMSLQHCPGGRSLSLRARGTASPQGQVTLPESQGNRQCLFIAAKVPKYIKCYSLPRHLMCGRGSARLGHMLPGMPPVWQRASSLERASGDLVPRSWQASARAGVVHHPPTPQ